MPLVIQDGCSRSPLNMVSNGLPYSDKSIPTSSVPVEKVSKTPLNDSNKIQQIYQTCVSTSSHYSRQKNIYKGTWKWILLKMTGVPLAFLYGISLVFIISNTVLGRSHQPFHMPGIDTQLPRNICNSILPAIKNHSKVWEFRDLHDVGNEVNQHYFLKQRTPLRKQSNISVDSNLHTITSTKTTQPSISFVNDTRNMNRTKTRHPYCGNGSQMIFDNDCPELYYGIGSLMGFVSLVSIFSRNIRATMLLLLPGLITRHSRHLIFTLTLGILANGPIKNIQDNFNKILDNTFCIYKSGITLACIKQMEIKEVLYYAENIHNEVQNIKNSFNRMICPYGRVDRHGNICNGLPDYKFPFQNISLDIVSDMSSPGSREIQKHARFVIEKIIVLAQYGDFGRRFLTIVSITFLIVDAVRYLRYFHTDSSFDNWCISSNTYRYWQTKDYYTNEDSLTYWKIEEGLRRWEEDQGFKMSIIPKLTKRELHKVWRNSFTTIAFTIFVLLTLFVDFLLAEAFSYIKENEHQNFHMDSPVHNITGSGIDEATRLYQKKSCLSSASYTHSVDYLVIGILLSTAVISCILQVFLSGTRAHLCHLFYPERAEERADYLYYNIFTGRMNRRNELLLIVRREIERRQKLVSFSPFHRILVYIRGVRSSEEGSFVCPGCGENGKRVKMRDLSFYVVNKTVHTNVCSFCHLDLFGEQGKKRVVSLYDHCL